MAMVEEQHPPHDVAASFAIGVFVTTLPTLGAGLLLFGVLAYVFDRVSTIALLASVAVLNPVVKWGVYAASYWLGTRLLGPVPGGMGSANPTSAGPEVATRLLAGNVVLAVVFAVAGYAIVLRLVRAYRRRDVDVVERIAEVVAE